MPGASDVHGNQPVLNAGSSLQDSQGVLLLLHGRGASAEGMLELYDELQVDHLHVLAPQAAGNTWYPNSFLAPMGDNQPYLDSALKKVAVIITNVMAAGVSSDRIAIMGFSQGACLTCEFIARNARRYGAAMALTGGVIGSPGTPRNYVGSLDETPVFLGTSNPDMHVPLSRVEETRDIFERMGARVELRVYAGMPHTVNSEEISVCRAMLQTMVNR